MGLLMKAKCALYTKAMPSSRKSFFVASSLIVPLYDVCPGVSTPGGGEKLSLLIFGKLRPGYVDMLKVLVDAVVQPVCHTAKAAHELPGIGNQCPIRQTSAVRLMSMSVKDRAIVPGIRQ